MTQNYISYSFKISPKEPWTDILLATLSTLPFESFEMTVDGLEAYIAENDWYENILEDIELLKNDEVSIAFEQKSIATENWNANWEAEFLPIQISDHCVVRADFHPSTGLPLELVITPKMSFGTGHHQTTQMMLNYGLEMKLENKVVLDMGCGTGILAILAAKKGANVVHGIDNDANCVLNSQENAQRNNQNKIIFSQSDTPPKKEEFYDYIFANITKNVLSEHLQFYYKCLKVGGSLVLSGIFITDILELTKKATAIGLNKESIKENMSWAAIHFLK